MWFKVFAYRRDNSMADQYRERWLKFENAKAYCLLLIDEGRLNAGAWGFKIVNERTEEHTLIC